MKKHKGLAISLVAFFLLFATAAITYVVQGTKEGVKMGSGTTTIVDDQQGDQMIFDGQVKVKANIFGDLFVMGGTVEVDGSVTEHLTVLGGHVTVDGNVRGNVYVFAGNVELNSDVRGDVVVFAGNVTMSGTYGDDVRMFAGNINADDLVVTDSLFVRAGTVNLGEKVTVIGEEDILESEKNEGLAEKVKAGFVREEEPTGTKILKTVVSVVGWVLLGLVVIRLAPVKAMNLFKCAYTWKDAVLSLLVGLMAIPAGFLLVVILALSRIGGMLAIFAILLALILLLIGWIFPAGGIAHKLLPLKKKNYYISLIVGVVVMSLLFKLPWGVGFGLRALFIAWGIGAIIVTKYKMLSDMRAQRASK